MSSPRSIDVVLAWWAERLPLLAFGGLASFVAVAGLVGADDPATGFLAAAGAAFILIAHFRLLDDLADRARDRVEHPSRVMPRAASVGPFRVLLALTFVCSGLTLGAIGRAWGPVGSFMLLHGALAGWYRLRPRPPQARDGLSAHIVLLKYAGIVYIVGAAAGVGLGVDRVLVLMLVYLTFALFEIHHDPALRSGPGAAWILRCELAGWLVVSVAVVVLVSPRPVPFLTIGSLVLGVLLLGIAFRRLPDETTARRWSPAVLVAGFLQVLALTIQ